MDEYYIEAAKKGRIFNSRTFHRLIEVPFKSEEKATEYYERNREKLNKMRIRICRERKIGSINSNQYSYLN
jgi:hypothetical protein